MTFQPIKSPCVGLCSTTYGDLVCRGCRRTSDEISIWHSLNDNQKLIIVGRLDTHIERLLSKLFIIHDSNLLLEKVRQLQLNTDTHRSPWAWLFVLLVKKAQDITNTQDYGFRSLVNTPLPALISDSLQTMYEQAIKK